MDEVKGKVKGLVKKLNNPFVPSRKFKGEGQKLGSALDLPPATSKGVRRSTAGGEDKKGRSGDQKQQQEDWKKLQQEKWERERRAKDLQRNPYAASTVEDGQGNVALRSVVASNSRGAGDAAVSSSASQGDLSTEKVFPDGSGVENVRLALQGQNFGNESDAFNRANISDKDELVPSFDPFSSQTGKHYDSNVSGPKMFQCPVCENWWRSEEEISAHVDHCLRASSSITSANPENDPEKTDERRSQIKFFEDGNEEIQSAIDILLSGGPSNDTLGVLIRLLRNILNDSASEKFRKIRMGNPKIHQTLGTTLGGVDLLESLGFCLTTEGDEIWAKMEPPSETQIEAIKHVITKLDSRLSESS